MLKIDLHVHSNLSLDGISTLVNIVAKAKKRGLDAIALTDHNTYSIIEEQVINGVLVFPACEISTRQGHVTALFCDSPCDIKKLTKNGLPDVKDVMEEIHNKNGIGIAAHPFARKKTETSMKHLHEMLSVVDGMETANARASFKQIESNKEALEYALKHNMPQIGGSDTHSTNEIGNAYTELSISKPYDKELIKKEILQGKSKPVLVRNTKRFYKGLSQLKKAKRSKELYKILRGYAYILYCVYLDIFYAIKGD